MVLMGAAGLAAAALAGCGSTVNDDDEATSGSGASGSGASGSGASGSGASGGGTTTGTGGTNQCSGFEDQTGSAEVTIRFRNEAPVPVYIPGTCSFVDYDIRPSSGEDGIDYANNLTCTQTCQQLQTEPAYVCDACAPSAWLVPPGGSLEVSWDGTGVKQEAMPDACYLDGQSPFGDTCSRLVAAQANTYRVEVTGFGTCEGFDEPGGPCACTEEGECMGSATGAQALADVSEFAYPGVTGVEVVFGPCAFGCPPDDDG